MLSCAYILFLQGEKGLPKLPKSQQNKNATRVSAPLGEKKSLPLQNVNPISAGGNCSSHLFLQGLLPAVCFIIFYYLPPLITGKMDLQFFFVNERILHNISIVDLNYISILLVDKIIIL
jgi:hypothetical protein